MRQIKFRAWDCQKKILFPVWDIRQDEQFGLRINEGEFYDASVGLMQFTGLLDKNGKEVFEGDIFESLHQIGIVKQKEGLWIVDWIKRPNALTEKLYPHCEEGKVIGSIHENPELLGESK